MNTNDVQNRADIEAIVGLFYERMLQDPIVGFIFVDVIKIDLQMHLPVIVDFWFDILFKATQSPPQTLYRGNTLQKHLAVNELVSIKPGHFTRWLYLFSNTIDKLNQGSNAELMKARAELIAKSISAAITDQKKSQMKLVLPK
ncbi:MAG: hemoglobin [Arenicella sp.]|jgi:hemoglobin